MGLRLRGGCNHVVLYDLLSYNSISHLFSAILQTAPNVSWSHSTGVQDFKLRGCNRGRLRCGLCRTVPKMSPSERVSRKPLNALNDHDQGYGEKYSLSWIRTLRSRETEMYTSVASTSITGYLSTLVRQESLALTSHSHRGFLNRLREASKTSGHMEHEKRQSKYRKT